MKLQDLLKTIETDLKTTACDFYYMVTAEGKNLKIVNRETGEVFLLVPQEAVKKIYLKEKV